MTIHNQKYDPEPEAQAVWATAVYRVGPGRYDVWYGLALQENTTPDGQDITEPPYYSYVFIPTNQGMKKVCWNHDQVENRTR